MQVLRRSPWALSAVALAAIAGAVLLGVSQMASATPAPATVNQGAPGNTPWPVSGTVNVGNLPATQAVSGTVNVGNFPATQTVASGDQTQILFDGNYTLDATGADHLGSFPVSAYREVRLLVETDGSSQQVSLGEAAGSRSVGFDLFTVNGTGQNRIYDTPGLGLEVDISGPPGATGSLLLVGRSN